MNTREQGYYWVKYEGQWRPAEWDGVLYWCFAPAVRLGPACMITDEGLEQIGPSIKVPAETTAQSIGGMKDYKIRPDKKDREAIVAAIAENLERWDFPELDDLVMKLPLGDFVEVCARYGAAIALSELLHEKPQFWIDKESELHTAVLGPFFITWEKVIMHLKSRMVRSCDSREWSTIKMFINNVISSIHQKPSTARAFFVGDIY